MHPPAVTFDFETHAIEPRPLYPPEPVGLAIRHSGSSFYWAWGHPTGNNCTRAEGCGALRHAFRSGARIVGHHLKFDLAVAQERLGLDLPSWGNLEDTLLLAFLDDPNRQNLSLKPLAEELLGEPPRERDRLYDWIRRHVPEARRKKNVGAWISRAPGRLVSPYARGDVGRTERLARRLRCPADLQGAYDRERELLPILLRMDQRGVPIDAERLAADAVHWAALLERVEAWIQKRLRAPGLDLNSHEELADALERERAITGWVLTEKGQRSVSMDSLRQVCVDEPLLNVLEYRTRLVLALRTFAEPWLSTGKDRIWTHWNQVRQPGEEHGARHFGARTGRLSCDPNFQNIPRVPGEVVTDAASYARALKGSRPIRLPRSLVKGDPADWQLPNLRDYIQAPPGSELLVRDYSQQELRILAHYAGGELREAYKKDPKLDLHAHAQGLVNRELRASYPRRHIKNVGFGIIYGAGLGKTASMLDEDEEVTGRIRSAYFRVFPGLQVLNRDLKKKGRRGEWFRTGGGRKFCVEPPAAGRTFEYKLLNTLIQGSAADVNKEAMVRYERTPGREGELLIQVHDEVLVLVPKRAAKAEMGRLKKAMESVGEWFSLPLPTEGKRGKTWARMTSTK